MVEASHTRLSASRAFPCRPIQATGNVLVASRPSWSDHENWLSGHVVWRKGLLWRGYGRVFGQEKRSLAFSVVVNRRVRRLVVRDRAGWQLGNFTMRSRSWRSDSNHCHG
jgi:hypothetical protein